MKSKVIMNFQFSKISANVTEINKIIEEPNFLNFFKVTKIDKYTNYSPLISSLDNQISNNFKNYSVKSEKTIKFDYNLIKTCQMERDQRLIVSSDNNYCICEDINTLFNSEYNEKRQDFNFKLVHLYSKLKFNLLSHFSKYKRDNYKSANNIRTLSNSNREIHFINGKPYYYQNGIYTDSNSTEYQMSSIKSGQNLNKTSEIQAILALETLAVPIWKDSNVSINSLKVLEDKVNNWVICERSYEGSRSPSADISSSSLNCSIINNNAHSSNKDIVINEFNKDSSYCITEKEKELYRSKIKVINSMLKRLKLQAANIAQKLEEESSYLSCSTECSFSSVSYYSILQSPTKLYKRSVTL